ncbi:butyrophilin subfamily 2 member A2-like [Thunnus thynnus]|uniref:butyrophilin subfamily 2 member A2-like n=1 Tax=Thunnus thynnus TaxID=8237 RepID=UPI003527A81A
MKKTGLFFLLFFLSATGNDTIICPSEPVKAAVGGNVTLDCHFESKRNVTGELVEWKFNGSLSVVVHRSEGFSPDDQAEQFENRTTLDEEKLGIGNLTVQISSVNTTDGGIYTCSVGVGPQQNSCNVHLIVEKSSNKSKAKSPEGTDTTPSLENGNENWKIIVGVVVGLLVALVVTACCCWWKYELLRSIWGRCRTQLSIRRRRRQQNPAAPGNPIEMMRLNQQGDDNIAG